MKNLSETVMLKFAESFLSINYSLNKFNIVLICPSSQLNINGDKVIMSQGSFRAEGFKEDNMYSLKGIYEGSEYRFRLYTLVDKYVFHREVWKTEKFNKLICLIWLGNNSE